MSWSVFIETIISKPKIRLLVYRGLFPLIREPVYIKSLPNVHIQNCICFVHVRISRITRQWVAPGNWASQWGFLTDTCDHAIC